MNVLIVCKGTLPPVTYGGTERVVWSLMKALHQLGHSVYILNPEPMTCDWATCITQQPNLSIDEQIPDEVDVVHFHVGGSCTNKPYVITRHGNNTEAQKNDSNSIFVSQKHALNHGCEAFVYNGLDWSDYHQPNLELNKRDNRYHFLGKAAWRLKNVQGAIDITKKANVALDVLGGHRLNFKMGFRLTLDRHVKFHGMVNNTEKCAVLEHSKGLIFPVTWEEPFGLAITESLFMGTPVFATPYGSLPELINAPEFGSLSNIEDELADAIKHGSYNPKLCHEYARDMFDHISMAKAYIEKYEKVLNGEALNQFLSEPVKQIKKLPYFR
ncbi:glycosyltransferase [Vibrio alginolyticus]|uniref:glycosyltransferase n=1 Tax=Vibrio TaxID=662 RepID=UPI00146AA020|nr:glycosyltransferase [Vibrio sp. 1167]EGR0024361.1 glycosyltransferase family 4 protein [Vibrio alginolyticus]EGR0303972.1 glycosyltransferase family 4 protein [Vibrio alginolyticus]MDW2301130.1 glycosyltransferase [Vibrio sp. 1167]NMT95802.1 glycosyltransferase [Vibrio alginolyticus]